MNTPKILMVGLNPSGKPIKKGCAWLRFHEWLDFLEIPIVGFINISNDVNFDGKKLSVDFENLKNNVIGHDKIIAWGMSVSKFLNIIDVKHFVLPHPSPRNRQINDKNFVENRLKECKKYIYEDSIR